jgi:tetratricopeptide (TPR) repeat protein
LAKKHKHSQAPAAGPTDLRRRVHKAQSEGRFQQALELAKQLARDGNADHLALLREITLGRARQLRCSGYTRDALTMLQAALHTPALPPQWLEQAAVEMALCGDAGAALAAVRDLSDSPAVSRIRGLCADACIQDPSPNRSRVPPSWGPDIDAILLASKQIEKGEDDAARSSLQRIGLRSPFLEWKLFLRGLQAYYQNDDSRALENWQRLDLGRLPARLAAPLRYRIDTAFRAAQPPATQAALQRQIEAMEGSSLLPRLRELQRHMENKNSLASAFRQAESLLPLLRAENAALVARLASCMYWAMLNTGPDDVRRYTRVFGVPPQDPSFMRLSALGNERTNDPEDAYLCWGDYEKDIAAHPEAWDGHARRARALVLLRMGQLALRAQREEAAPLPRLPLWFEPDRPRKLHFNPPPVKCFEKARSLADDLLPAYDGMFRYYLDRGEDEKAATVGRELLARFAEHAPTLQEVAGIAQRMGDTAEALRLTQAALSAHPLDRELRTAVIRAHFSHARALVKEQAFEEARAQLHSAVALQGASTWEPTCILAALEFKAGHNQRAEELLQQCADAGDPPLAVSYAMLVETTLCKLPPRVKTRFDRSFKEGLAATSDGRAAARLFQILTLQTAEGLTYHGQKTHRKKILEYGERATHGDLSEADLQAVVAGFLMEGGGRQLRRVMDQAQRRFPTNPYFVVFEARCLLEDERTAPQLWRIKALLDEASRLARLRLEDEGMKKLLDEIATLQRQAERMNPMATIFESFASGDDFGPDDADYTDDDDFLD